MRALEQEGNVKILVDTNVWLDAYLGFRPGCSDAVKLFKVGHCAQALFLYPVGALQDVFALLIMELKRNARSVGAIVDKTEIACFRNIAWACIDNMREFATAVGADESDIWLAAKYRTFNWDLEDNMILASAQRAQADYLTTNDKALIEKSTVAALTPRDLAEVLSVQ